MLALGRRVWRDFSSCGLCRWTLPQFRLAGLPAGVCGATLSPSCLMGRPGSTDLCPGSLRTCSTLSFPW